MSASPPATPGAFRHLPGIGPEREKRLRARGMATWDDLLRGRPGELPGLGLSDALGEVVARSRRAFDERDLATLVNLLARPDQWRLLHDFHHEATYLDIETTGREEAEITVIVALHRGTLHTYVQGENLDAGFLDLLDDTRLLVTFNGVSFDIPQIENWFHIPPISTPHIDLRWVCYHAGLAGGLKEIERALGIKRPRDLVGTDGAEAVWLWDRWCTARSPAVRTKLLRYCAADVIALDLVRAEVLGRLTGNGAEPSGDPWTLLPDAEVLPEVEPPVSAVPMENQAARRDRLHRRLRAELRRG